MDTRSTDLVLLLTRELDTFVREIRMFPDDGSVWSVPPGVTNSAGNLTAHVCGSLQHFVGAVLGHTGYVRDRSREFGPSAATREELASELGATIDVIKTVLPGIHPEQFDETFPEPVGGVDLRTGLFLTHLWGHVAFHLGQVGYLRRLMTKDNQSTSPLPVRTLA